MPFVAMPQEPGVPTNWTPITHIRVIEGKRPDTPHALERWTILAAVADLDGTIPLGKVFELVEPVRSRGGREAGIKADLRCWSNDDRHGNNSQDKGWLELGRKTSGKAAVASSPIP